MEEDGTDRLERADSRHIHSSTGDRQTSREGERRFQPQSPINRKHLTPHFSTRTDQMMISGTSTITRINQKHHLQTNTPHTHTPSCLALWGWVLTQQKFPAGEIPLLEVSRGEKEEEGLSPCLLGSERFNFEFRPDGCSVHHHCFFFFWCVARYVCVHDNLPQQPMWQEAVTLLKLCKYHQDPLASPNSTSRDEAQRITECVTQ